MPIIKLRICNCWWHTLTMLCLIYVLSFDLCFSGACAVSTSGNPMSTFSHWFLTCCEQCILFVSQKMTRVSYNVFRGSAKVVWLWVMYVSVLIAWCDTVWGMLAWYVSSVLHYDYPVDPNLCVHYNRFVSMVCGVVSENASKWTQSNPPQRKQQRNNNVIYT